MAITIPNTFIAGSAIEGDKVEANNNAIKTWTNGNMITADLTTAFKWCGAPQVMNGFYNATINQHEFATGVVQGAPVFPKYTIGAIGISMGDAATGLLNEPQLPTYPIGNGNTPIPRTYFYFTLEKQATICYQITLEMYPLDDETGAFAREFQSTVLTTDVDGVLREGSRHICQAMGNVGTMYTNAPEANVIPMYEGVREYNYSFVTTLAAGDHYIGIQGCSNEQVTWLGRAGISLECYY
jgi:hypothetical protein